MNDRTGWNTKGLHTRARDAAREAARQEGLTLGEYLDQLISEESESQRTRQMNEIPRSSADARGLAGFGDDRRDTALDRLIDRIEAVEARSTLAISGIDQSVVGLLKRLEQADQANSELGGHVDTLMDDIRATHGELRAAIERIEADDGSRRALEGMRAIETALAKLADHVYSEGEANQSESHAIKGRIESGFADLDQRLEDVESTVNTRLKAVDDRVDQAVEAAEQRSQGAANHLANRFTSLEQSVSTRLQSAETAIAEAAGLNERVEALESGMSEAIGNLEDTLRNLQDRLQSAEAGTNAALQRLENRFGSLDERIRTVAGQVVETDRDALTKGFETRFESLAQDLRASIDRTRSELAGQIEAAATSADPAIFTALRGDIDSLRVAIEDNDRRHADALSVLTDRLDSQDSGAHTSALEDRLDQFTTAVEQRLTYVETGVSGMGEANVISIQEDVERLAATVENRLDGIESREAATITRLGDQMTRLTDTLDERIAESERNSASAIEQLGQTVANITRRMEARHNEALSDMEQKLANSQDQQSAHLQRVTEQVSARLEEMQAVSRENVSPVQRAIASLAARLDAIESFNAPPFTDAAIEQEAFGGGPSTRPFVETPDAKQRLAGGLELDQPHKTPNAARPGIELETLVSEDDAPSADALIADGVGVGTGQQVSHAAEADTHADAFGDPNDVAELGDGAEADARYGTVDAIREALAGLAREAKRAEASKADPQIADAADVFEALGNPSGSETDPLQPASDETGRDSDAEVDVQAGTHTEGPADVLAEVEPDADATVDAKAALDVESGDEDLFGDWPADNAQGAPEIASGSAPAEMTADETLHGDLAPEPPGDDGAVDAPPTALPKLADEDVFKSSEGVSAAPFRVSLPPNLTMYRKPDPGSEVAAVDSDSADGETVNAADESDFTGSDHDLAATDPEDLVDGVGDAPSPLEAAIQALVEAEQEQDVAAALTEADADPANAETGAEAPLADPAFAEMAPSETAFEETAPEEAALAEAGPDDSSVDIGRWDAIDTPDTPPGFDAEPLSPDVTVGFYAEDFSDDPPPHIRGEAVDGDLDPLKALENWPDAAPAGAPSKPASDETAAAAIGQNDDGLFESEDAADGAEAGSAGFEIPRPSLAEQAIPLDSETSPTDYLKEARAAAIAAADQTEAKRIRGSASVSKVSLIAIAAAVGVSAAGAAGYLYLRGKQSPTPPVLGETAPATSASAAAATAGPATTDTAASAGTGTAAGALAALLETPGAPAGDPDTARLDTASDRDLEAALFDGAGDGSSAGGDGMGTAGPSTAPLDAQAQPVAFDAGAPEPSAQIAPYAPIPAGRSIIAAVEAGDPVAEFLHGQDLVESGAYAEGVELVSAAARDGIAAAQYRLAKLHERGVALPRDMQAARIWTERAATGNNVMAMHDVAVFYAEGEGGDQSYAQAAEWFGKAAAYGLVDSQYNLAVLYERGLGVTENLSEAAFWFAVAEGAGDSGAGARLATLRDKMTPDAHDEAVARAERWRASEPDARANGTFQSKSWGFGAPNQVEAVQIALVALGNRDVVPSGSMDTATSQAIRRYEDRVGLPSTGTLTPDLIRSLNEGATTAS